MAVNDPTAGNLSVHTIGTAWHCIKDIATHAPENVLAKIKAIQWQNEVHCLCAYPKSSSVAQCAVTRWDSAQAAFRYLLLQMLVGQKLSQAAKGLLSNQSILL